MSSSDSDSTSDDDFIIGVLQVLPRPRSFRDRSNPFTEYDDTDFKQRFRLSKTMFIELLDMVQDHLCQNTQCSMSLSPILQLLIALRYYATGVFQAVLGDHIRIHKSTVCRIVKKVSTCIASLKPKYIQMPKTEADRKVVYEDFYKMRQCPKVIGAIDCTHIRIQSPNKNIGERFRNRKGYFSINVQAVCNSNLQFKNIVARWPGSVHDSTIFDNSLLRAQFENNEFGDAVMVGDGGYACRNYMMTPLSNPVTEAEIRYQKAQIGTGNVIERTFGVWKRRFPVLLVGIRTQIPTTLVTIIATAVLHNMLINSNDPLPVDETLLIEDLRQQVPVFLVPQTGNIKRRTLIDTVFI
ncbi:putative nuclease HARBI1 [Metopolophium dirhodum]|uniref:putative nuclease HARBI1 n=1 Tax=Metopolophium dirhodum TaxID=44670 RepID=UPI00299074E3|nr:putative nuclease HARBI1 [Metopolophium dirhodum]